MRKRPLITGFPLIRVALEDGFYCIYNFIFCRLFERLNEEDQSAAAYTEYLNESERRGVRTLHYITLYTVT